MKQTFKSRIKDIHDLCVVGFVKGGPAMTKPPKEKKEPTIYEFGKKR